jgi:hypothetical protein
MAVSSAGLRLLWQGPEAIVKVNYRPILSSERVPHIKKPANVREMKEIWAWDPDGIPAPMQTGRSTVGRKLTSTSTSTSFTSGSFHNTVSITSRRIATICKDLSVAFYVVLLQAFY